MRTGAQIAAALLPTCVALQLRNPGAGIDSAEHEAIRAKIVSGEPGNAAYKDGFFHVSCMNEGMLKWADLDSPQGEKRYAAENVNVTIVRYERMVAQEKREAMTPKVCYELCRMVPDMEYFGLVNGRECYCMPYFKAEAGGEDEMCDAPCDGDSTQMCGGKTKSDIYEMHECANTMSELAEVANSTTTLVDTVNWFYTRLETCSVNLQTAGDTIGTLDGDSIVGDHAVKTKQGAGVFEVQAKDAGKVLQLAMQAITSAEGLATGSDGATDADTVRAGEDILASLAKLTVDLQEAEAELESAYVKCGGSNDSATMPAADGWVEDPAGMVNGTLPDYRSVSKFASTPVNETADLVCEGLVLGEPSYRPTTEACADWCSYQGYPKKCVAFQLYASGVCLLFESVSGLSSFTGCATPSSTASCMMRESESKGFAFEKEQDYQKCPTGGAVVDPGSGGSPTGGAMVDPGSGS